MDSFNGFRIGSIIRTRHKGKLVDATIERLDSVVFQVNVNGVSLLAMWYKNGKGRISATTEVR